MSDATTHLVIMNGLLDLASEEMGGQALYCSDEFFASMHNLTKAGRGVFLPDEFTDDGKWMDGWESGRTRRRSTLQDRDECILKLGAAGLLRAVDIDTNHFLGNHPPYASLEALCAPWDTSTHDLRKANWKRILEPSALRPGSQNLFSLVSNESFTHVKLTIYPDGGVARLRVYGEVDSKIKTSDTHDEETRARVPDSTVDLAAAKNGGLVLGCSDMFFGPMHNLILPGRARVMREGWETRRRRGPGHDWIVLRLGIPGTLHTVEVDTNHFKGNYPDDCILEGANAPGATITDLLQEETLWTTVLGRSPLTGHTRHFYHDEIAARGPFTHLRLHVFPDGGISRLRAWGSPSS